MDTFIHLFDLFTLGVLVIEDSSTAKTYTSLNTWLKLSFGLSSRLSTDKLCDLLPERQGDEHKPVAVILDHFDDATTHANLISFITSLATDSVNNKNMVVMVIVNNPAFYHTLVSVSVGDDKKILSACSVDDSDVWKWSRDMLAALFDEQVR